MTERNSNGGQMCYLTSTQLLRKQLVLQVRGKIHASGLYRYKRSGNRKNVNVFQQSQSLKSSVLLHI